MSQKIVHIVELPEHLYIVYLHLLKIFLRWYLGSFLGLLLMSKWNYPFPSENKFSIKEVIFRGFLLIYNCNYIKGIFLLGEYIFNLFWKSIEDIIQLKLNLFYSKMLGNMNFIK